jgi:hypothetical protein
MKTSRHTRPRRLIEKAHPTGVRAAARRPSEPGTPRRRMLEIDPVLFARLIQAHWPLRP